MKNYQTNYILDPHTAIGVAAAEALITQRSDLSAYPMICLATAHPCKFPEALYHAFHPDPNPTRSPMEKWEWSNSYLASLGNMSGTESGTIPWLPERVRDLSDMKERCLEARNEENEIRAIIQAI